MARITVKGIGKVSMAPDMIVLSLWLETHDFSYDQAMEKASLKIAQLQDSLEVLGFNKEEMKTSDFNVNTNYNSYRDEQGNYHKELNGYIVKHRINLRFDLDMDLLSRTLEVISKCLANPQLSINFTIKDDTKVSEELLIQAAKNARRKAEILCKASNVKLGKLMSIDYNWGEISLLSPTRYEVAHDYMASKSIEMEPEDIEISDTVTFAWEVE